LMTARTADWRHTQHADYSLAEMMSLTSLFAHFLTSFQRVFSTVKTNGT